MSSSIFNLTNPELYVITAAHEGQVSGQITTWVTLGALVPEHFRVVTVISPRNFTFALIQSSQRFVVNFRNVNLFCSQFMLRSHWVP
jgi:flavin reductase (DIM6/NTAB) family NADH-FMN oxidoreductase RutF